MKRLLIVDDEKDVAELLHIFFSVIGIQSRICLNAKSALKALEEEDYLAVFCDFSLPDMEGDTFFKTMKAKCPELAGKFVLMTGLNADSRVDRFIESERVRVLRKPFKLEDAQSLVKKLQEEDTL
jgi:DNA-binding NtrC family response regulator